MRLLFFHPHSPTSGFHYIVQGHTLNCPRHYQPNKNRSLIPNTSNYRTLCYWCRRLLLGHPRFTIAVSWYGYFHTLLTRFHGWLLRPVGFGLYGSITFTFLLYFYYSSYIRRLTPKPLPANFTCSLQLGSHGTRLYIGSIITTTTHNV